MSRRETLEAQKKAFDGEAREAREILRKCKSDNRNPTNDETSKINALLAKLRPINEALDQLDVDDEVMAMAKGMSDAIGGVGGGLSAGGSTGGANSDSYNGKDSGKRLSFKGMGAAVAAKVPDNGRGQKSLAANLATVVAQEFIADPVGLGQIADTLLDILPTYPHTSPEFSFLRQNTRTNAAAVVADGAEKPESVYGLVRVEQSLQVVAHVSEPISKYWMVDNGSIHGFVENELRYGLGRAIEAKVLADINGTSGIQTQAYSTSVLQTIRKTLTKLQVVGLDAAGILLHPTDWEGLELALTSAAAIEYRGLPYDPAARRLWGVPIVVNMTQTAGVSHTIAKESVGLNTDGMVDLEWSKDDEDNFKKNLLIARCETRVQTSVFRPLGVVVGDLTA